MVIYTTGNDSNFEVNIFRFLKVALIENLHYIKQYILGKGLKHIIKRTTC